MSRHNICPVVVATADLLMADHPNCANLEPSLVSILVKCNPCRMIVRFITIYGHHLCPVLVGTAEVLSRHHIYPVLVDIAELLLPDLPNYVPVVSSRLDYSEM